MQRLVDYQMRIVATLLLIIISSAILFSYWVIPANLSVQISDFYRQHWYLQTKLFIIAAVFLLFAYSVEREWLATSWPQRLIACCLVAVFIREFIELINSMGLLLAFVN